MTQTPVASFMQLIHRQQFKHALAWRKSLTKQERIFLESYCMGKCHYGGDKLSTKWHRFALKICLAKVVFQIVSLPTSDRPGLLHVKHPALLSVIQKRGEETIVNYEHLSSLQEECLVEQVGLDVKLDDMVKVITLPGTAYVYWV